MKFIMYTIIVMLSALVQSNSLYAMDEYIAARKAVLKAAEASPTTDAQAKATAAATQKQSATSATIALQVTLITTFNFPTANSCGSGVKVVTKKPETIAMNPDKTLEEHMSDLQKHFDSYFPLSFSKNENSAPFALATKIHALGTTSIVAHKSQKLPCPPKDGLGE